MKHTIKTHAGMVGVDTTAGSGTVLLGLRDASGAYVGLQLTADTLGAVIFSLEQAGEALEVDAVRVACRGDRLCTVPAACPTPIACGVPA